jgi:SpoVK/Ycf46/Vps4 family AAA+-type ATPase
MEDLLAPEKFVRVQDSLVAHGMRKGFACLFYGAPGTGKTETVLQLARKTGRDIMQVDMSQMRDKFVGESEKNVKAIFTRYRRLCQESDITPILLLNEADAYSVCA